MDEITAMRVLKGVSRSFYLSLRLLPSAMREAASLAYLLARTSDTLADSAGVPCGVRIEALEVFREALARGGDTGPWRHELVAGLDDCRERALLGQTAELIGWIKHLPEEQSRLVRQVVMTIIDGQRLDLERFGRASESAPVVLGDEQSLDDYTWRVAGCVGEFWTRLGAVTMGGAFSVVPEESLVDRAVAYGKGLQLVNILRDLPKDMAVGRCYLPVDDPEDLDALMRQHHIYVIRATDLVHQGFEYAECLRSRRVKMASVLPAMIAVETLELMRGLSWEELSLGVKVPRSSVYRSLISALFQ